MLIPVKLKELGDIITGNTPSKKEISYWDSKDICFVKPDSISEQGISIVKNTTEYLSEKASSKARIVTKDAVFVTCIGTIGKIGLAAEGRYAFNQQINVVVPNTKVLPKYLAYALLSSKKRLEDIANAPVVPIINKTQFGEFSIKIEDNTLLQKNIVNILDKVVGIIDFRRKELQCLDNLVKARFVEMFGDPIRNTQKRKTTEFINVVKMQRGFDLPVQDRMQDGEVPVYGSNGALDRHDKAKVQGGGVITGRSGTIGKVFYTEGDYWPLNTSLFSVDTHGNNVVYLAYLLEMYDLTRFVEGTGVPTLNRNMFHNKQIIEVELAEQNQFASFVKQVDKSKVVVPSKIKNAIFVIMLSVSFGQITSI